MYEDISTNKSKNKIGIAEQTSDLAAISMVHTFFNFLVLPCASSCKLVYFSSMSNRSCCRT